MEFPKTIFSALSLLREKKLTALELVNMAIDNIEKHDNEIGSFISTCFYEARDKAKKMDELGDFSLPLAGIPYSLKDVISKKGLKNTAASKILENYEAPFDATIVEKLEKAGAILIGKVNLDEFTMGSSNENSAIKITKNPIDNTKVAGGSSGGSAASVKKGMGLFSIGTDTGGSIRQPANFCGVTGLKVSYGRVSRYGIISYASSFDSIGPIAQSVDCVARVLEVIAGKDEKDSTTPNIPVPKYSQKTLNPISIQGKKFGIIKEFMEREGISEDVKASFNNTIELIKKEGGEIIELSLPLTEYVIPTYYLLVKAEASTNLARYDGIRFGSTDTDNIKSLEDQYVKTRSKYLGDEVKRAIMMGTFTLSSGYFDAYYLKASKVRNLIQKEYHLALDKVDTIIAPVSPVTAFKIGEKSKDPLEMYLSDIFTVSANLSGICGLAIPTEIKNKSAYGIQILNKPFEEENLLEIGKGLEKIM